MIRDIALDNPAQQQKEDEFNRWPFSKSLADTIAGFKASQGAPVLGLFGTWGSGKSTVLNFVQAALEKDHGARVTVFPFNPWLFKDPDTLLQEFFGGLAKHVDAKLDKSGKKAGKWMASYGGSLSAIPVVGAGVGKAVESLGKDLTADTTQAQRDRVTKFMRAAERKVVVLIDDLDRLDRDEIMTMLKVVRLSANFPNVVYLLAFDEERVGRVAGQAYGERTDGRQFLEKIIQYPFSLPAISPDRLAAYVIRHAQMACDATGLRLDEKTWNEFRRICKDILLVRLNTPRQAIRYANALRFALPMLKGEVDAFDQMLVEAARILFPDLYAVLSQRQSFELGASEDIIKTLESKHPTILPDESQAAQRLVETLLRWERSSAKPISKSRYHGRYFTYAVAPDDISDAELNGLLELAGRGEQDAVDTSVRALARDRLTSLAERLLCRLEFLDLQSANTLVVALAQIGDLLPTEIPMDDQEMASSVGALITKLASLWMPLRAQSQNFVAPTVIERAMPLPFALVIYRELGRVRQEESKTQATLNESRVDHDWTELRGLLKRRIKTDAQAHPPYNGLFLAKDALRLLQFWQSTEPEEEKAWLERRLTEHPGETNAFLSLFPDQLISYQFIAELAAPSVIADALHRHWGDALTDLASNPKKILIAREFLEAHQKPGMG